MNVTTDTSHGPIQPSTTAVYPTCGKCPTCGQQNYPYVSPSLPFYWPPYTAPIVTCWPWVSGTVAIGGTYNGDNL